METCTEPNRQQEYWHNFVEILTPTKLLHLSIENQCWLSPKCVSLYSRA